MLNDVQNNYSLDLEYGITIIDEFKTPSIASHPDIELSTIIAAVDYHLTNLVNSSLIW